MDKKIKSIKDKDLNENNNLDKLKQFIIKNKKQNQILEKILKKINQSIQS